METRQIDLTKGTIWKQVLAFALPLVLTNLLQQAYNTADLMIVGNLSDDYAMAAIGATGSLIFLLLGLFIGFSIGASILVAHAKGANDPQRLYRAVHTTYATGILSGIVLTIIAIIFVPTVLQQMGTPENIFDEAVTYTRIYFLGSVPLLLYNMGTGILRSVGDSKSPLFYLLISSAINIVLDIIFVGPLKMRATGAAVATVIAQTITTILLTKKLMDTDGAHKLILREIKLYKEEFLTIIRIGIPAGIQSALISFSNVLIQSRVNTFGHYAIAGVSGANRYDAFMVAGLQALSMTGTTFTGQNFGAKKMDRLKKGARTSALIGAIYSFIVGLILIIFGRPLMSLFNDTPAVVDFGYRKMSVLARFHWIFTIAQVLSGVIRGVGLSFFPMAVSIFTMIGVRTFWNFVVPDILLNISGWEDFAVSIDLIFWSYPVSWLVTLLLIGSYYLFWPWIEKAIRKAQDRITESPVISADESSS